MGPDAMILVFFKCWILSLVLHPANKAFSSVQFSSVHSLSRVQLFVTPWIAARQASLSITNSQSSLRLASIESVMPSSHLILCYFAANTCCQRWLFAWWAHRPLLGNRIFTPDNLNSFPTSSAPLLFFYPGGRFEAWPQCTWGSDVGEFFQPSSSKYLCL